MKGTPSTVTLRDGRVVELRSPDAGDAAATLEFVRRLSRESSRNLNHPPSFFEAMAVDGQAAFLESLGAHLRSFMIAAWDGSAVVGSTNLSASSATFSAHTGELGLGVLEAYRGLGLGRALMERLITTAASHGVPNLLLRVRTFNAPAIALYESLGFTRVGTLAEVARLPEGPADEHLYQRVDRA